MASFLLLAVSTGMGLSTRVSASGGVGGASSTSVELGGGPAGALLRFGRPKNPLGRFLNTLLADIFTKKNLLTVQDVQ